MARRIRAITFDFWRTLFYAQRGSEDRRAARVRVIAEGTGLPVETVTPAFKVVSHEFLRVHIAEQRTLAPIEAIPMLERELSTRIPDETGGALAEDLADAFLAHPPVMIEDALAAVEGGAGFGPVGLISDTGLTPGSRIRSLLEEKGFGTHISAYSFSDEVGVAKPQSGIFHHAADQLGVAPEEILHVGDLEPTDVAGAINVRAMSGLFAGDNDRYAERTKAERVYLSWRAFLDDLPVLFG